MNKICIVMVNYNDEVYIEKCLRSVMKLKEFQGKIIVVDNKSTDKSMSIINDFPNIDLIKSDKNIGWGAATNVGIKKAIEYECEYVLLLNTDVLVADDMLVSMLEFADNNTICTPLMYRGDINSIDVSNTTNLEKWYAGGIIKENGDSNPLAYESSVGCVEVEFISGCCMLVPIDVFFKVGFIDEKYFLYYEDMDFCKRAVDCDVKLLYVPKTYLIHAVGGSQGGEINRGSVYYTLRNRLYFAKKYNLKMRDIEIVNEYLKERGIAQCQKYAQSIFDAINDYLIESFGEKEFEKDKLEVICKKGFCESLMLQKSKQFNYIIDNVAEFVVNNNDLVANIYRVYFCLRGISSEKIKYRIYCDGNFIFEENLSENVGLKIKIEAEKSCCIQIVLNTNLIKDLIMMTNFGVEITSSETTELDLEDIDWAYSHYLMRECESDMRDEKIWQNSFSCLVKNITSSDEYALKG